MQSCLKVVVFDINMKIMTGKKKYISHLPASFIDTDFSDSVAK